MLNSSGYSKGSMCACRSGGGGQKWVPCCHTALSMSIHGEEKSRDTVFAVPGCHSTHVYGMSDTQPGSHSTHQQQSVCVPPSTPSPHCTAQSNTASPVQYSRAKDPKRPVYAQLDLGSPEPPRASSVCTCVCMRQISSLCKHTPWHLCVCVHIWLCVQSWECLAHPTQVV